MKGVSAVSCQRPARSVASPSWIATTAAAAGARWVGMVFAVGVVSVALLVSPLAMAQNAPLPPCSDQQVRYGPPGEAYRSRVRVERVPASASPGRTAPPGASASPQGTVWFVQAEPEFTRPGPWRTTLTVTPRAAGVPGLVATFADHASYGVKAHWLNEKLLFVEAWWGRVVATDLVLDVEGGKVVYAEDADFSATILPCADAASPSP